MKALRVMLSMICALMGIFLTSSFYSGATAQTTPQEYRKPAVVFDLGGVVFDTDKASFIEKNLGGPHKIGPYAMRNLFRILWIKAHIKQRWYHTLKRVAQKNNNTFTYRDSDGNAVAVKDQEGNPLPTYIVEWLTGNRSNQEICSEVCTCIEKHPNWFVSFEQDIMLNMTKGTFNPEQFVSSQYCLESTINLMKTLKKEGYPLYILSNWDRESFTYMMETYPEIEELIDGFVVSGFEQVAKPDRRIYELFEQRYPHHAYILLDDQPDNIAMAKSCGWYGITVKTGRPQIKKINKKIIAFNDAVKVQNELSVTA